MQGVVIMATARDAGRVGGRRARAATSVATVNSLLQTHRARKNRAAGEAPPGRRVRLVRDAAAGPVLHMLVASYEPRGDG